jgi:hypothetical protein
VTPNACTAATSHPTKALSQSRTSIFDTQVGVLLLADHHLLDGTCILLHSLRFDGGCSDHPCALSGSSISSQIAALISTARPPHTAGSRLPLLPSLPAKRHSSTGRRVRMAPLVTATLVVAAGTAVLLMLAHRLSPRLAAQPAGFPACRAEVILTRCCHNSALVFGRRTAGAHLLTSSLCCQSTVGSLCPCNVFCANVIG